MRVNTSHFPLSFNQLRSWISSDRLAYLLILFTLAMGAITAYVLANADYVSDDTDLLMVLLGVDVLALAVLALLVGRQFFRLWVERRRRLAGQRVLAHVPTHHLETGEYKPVTAARRFIAEAALVPPALLNVRRNEHTTDRFFWGEKGLFSAQYAEENHFLFPSLRVIVDSVGEDQLFEGLDLAADDWEEMEEYEYAFV